MPSIYLYQTSSSIFGSATIKEESYGTSNLFKKYKHTIKYPITEKIWLYKTSSSLFNWFPNYATLQTQGEYANSKLQHAEVYFNKFDKTSRALVCLLKFDTGQDRIYKDSEHSTYIDGGSNTPITTLTEFTSGKNILDEVIKENDSLQNILTYNIGKTQGDKNGNGNYNGGKIKVTDHSASEPKLSESGFKRYKHEPQGGNGNKKACVIFDGNVLLQKNGATEVENIQGKEYKEIIVYIGEKAKNKDGSKPLPLLIELTKKSSPAEPDYFVHKRDPNNKGSFYWVNLNDTLKDLLNDMGFGMTKSELGYEQLKTLLSKPGVLNGHVGNEDLSTKLKGITGGKLKQLLEQPVGQESGSANPTLLVLLLRQIEFNLVDSVIILLEQKNPPSGQYDDGQVTTIVGNLVPRRDINRVDMNNGNGKKITVSDETNNKGQCVKDYKYKLIEHNFSTLVQGLGEQGKSAVGIRFIIPSENNHDKYKQLKLYNGDKTEPNNIVYYYYQKNGDSTSNSNKVYVWFYGSDPRPLMLCYNNTTYAPKTKETYFTQWYKVNDLSNGNLKDCGCPQGHGAHLHDPEKNKLLKQLDKVVKFLNKVDLKQGTSDLRDSYKYTVHTFKSKQIQIQVKCSTVGDTSKPPPPPPPGPGTCSTSTSATSCYKKFEHKPIGMQNGLQNGSGFRLGEVVYNGSSGTRTGTLTYASLGSKYKYYPLVGVTVFYYDPDKDYDDPLLIELEFKTNGGVGAGGAGPKEYYKLETQGAGSSGDTLNWEKDTTANDKMGNNNTAVEHLDSIRYSLKKVMKIYIDQQSTYQLCLSEKPGAISGGYTQENGHKQIEVSECIEGECSKLKLAGYVCYVHKVSQITGDDSFDYNEIGGLKFYISGKNGGGVGENDIEIPLYNGGESSTGQIQQITYNTCMKDIYVFFYCKNGTGQDCGSTPPTAPLMLLYNSKYYRPENIDSYFKKWICEPTLKGSIDKPCCDNGKSETLVTKLNEVNKCLNRIKLTETSGNTYGIPPPQEPPKKQPNIDVNRIKVTQIPSKTKPERPYCKLVHRTKNSFSIGDIYYDDQDITNGVKINGGGTITVNGGNNNHTSFISGANEPNTVVAYYHKDDQNHKLPQLIVLMNTNEAISSGTDPIKASDRTNYGYYVLATNNGGSYKYEWREPENEPPKQLILNDETEFSLLNAVVILVEQQTQYREDQISQAVKSATTVRSPGNTENGVNRLKEKTIDAHEETGSSATEYGDPGKCVREYGYKLYSHDIGAFKEWSPTNGQRPGQLTIPLIGGLRFLVPSSTIAGNYDEISLYKDEEATGLVDRLYHSPTGTQNTQNKVYVYFYSLDPRPLLLCYGSNAYKPKKTGEPIDDKQVNVDYTRWVKVKDITECVCMGSDISDMNKHILDTLLNVVCFLNPVQLNPRKLYSPVSVAITSTKPPNLPKPEEPTSRTYNIHKYKANSYVKMKITRTDICCYEKYTYEPAGTNGGGNNGKGFRLGTVFYTSFGGEKPTATLNYSELSPSSKYNPLLRVTVYYYQHDTKYEEPLLIELMFKFEWQFENSYKKYYYKLESVDGTGSSEMKWTIDSDARGAIGDGKDVDTQKLVEYLDKLRYLFKNVLQLCIAIKKTESYPANLFNIKGQPLTPEDTIDVPVSEEQDCQSLTGTEFRCFKHGISSLEPDQLHKFAALEFFIPNESGRLVPMNLFELPTSTPLKPLYYNCGMGDIYVYFYGKGSSGSRKDHSDGDPRPLLLCYNRQSYKPESKNSYFKKWIKDTQITGFECNKADDKLLSELVNVSNFLNPVAINKAVEGIYRVHQFNGEHISINLAAKLSDGKFCYHKYVHKPNEGYRLGTIEYFGKCIRELSEQSVGDQDSGTCITSVLDKPDNKYTPASEVVVYYYKRDTSLKNPLLVALCSKLCDDGVGSTSSTCTCQPYYELQRSSTITTTNKIYIKQSKDLKLEERRKSDLEKLLDKILYYMSKSLLINLSFKIKTTTVQYVGTSGKQNMTINKNTYLATVYENQVGKHVKTKDVIEIYVSGPNNIIDATGKQTGYMCYRHKISTVQNVNQIGGLRLFLWDNRTGEDNDENQCKITEPTNQDKKKCCEIKLYEQCDQSNKQNQEIAPIAYTTCKGDLYVYFYGDDPRPLLLCYNGQAYKPSDLNTYNEKWCYVSGIESCQCDEKGFDPNQVLPTLYKTSMFLNPVRLSETITAYQVAKVVIDKRKQAKEKGEYTGKLGVNLPEHNYTVQTFGDRDIKMKVKAKDLLCYRQSIGNKGLLRYKNMCKLILIMYYICIYVKIYTG